MTEERWRPVMIRTQMQKVLLYPLLAGGFLILFGVSYLSSHEIIMSLFRGAVYLVLSLVVLLTAPFSRLKGGFRKAEVSVGKTLFYVRIPGKDYILFDREKLQLSQMSGTRIRMKAPGLNWVGTPLEIEFTNSKDVESIVEELRHA